MIFHKFDSKNVSLTWIIKAFWKISLEISPHDLPHFLDENSIDFLFKVANLENEFDVLKNMKKNNFLHHGSSVNESQTINRTKSNANLSDLSRNHVKDLILVIINNILNYLVFLILLFCCFFSYLNIIKPFLQE